MLLINRASSPRTKCTEGKILKLQFKTRMPPHLFTGGNIMGERGAAIHIILMDLKKGLLIQDGPQSAVKLDIVVLEGDFNDEPDNEEEFGNHVVKACNGKNPLLIGDHQVTLKGGDGDSRRA